jgi:hypothetical protein
MQKVLILTAVVVAGRNIIVIAAITRITELSLAAAIAAFCESAASRCAMPLYTCSGISTLIKGLCLSRCAYCLNQRLTTF